MSRKAKFLFRPCCFVSGARTSGFCEFYLFLIATFLLSNFIDSLCPPSVFFNLRPKASPLTNQWMTRGEMCMCAGRFPFAYL